MSELYQVEGQSIFQGQLLAIRALLNDRQCLLLVDTGATHIALLPEIIRDHLRLEPVGTGEITAAGVSQSLATDVYHLDSASVLAREATTGSEIRLTITDLEVVSIEWPRTLGVDGLIGMNWLSRFPKVCLDLVSPALELHLP